MARIELSDMIVGLRKELQEAQAKAEKEDLKFKVDSIEVEAQVTLSQEVSGNVAGKWKFWVLGEVGGKVSGTVAKEAVQTIRLKLTPEQNGGPVKVTREAARPT